MGVKGAALATIISQAVSALWVLRFLTGNRTVLKIRKENLKIDFKVLLPCLALGLSPFIMQSTESILIVSFNTSLLKYGGDLAVGAMTILSECDAVFYAAAVRADTGCGPDHKLQLWGRKWKAGKRRVYSSA